MSQLRFDHTTADWVVFAPLRSLRPHASKDNGVPKPTPAAAFQATCPFCPGNERMAPHEIDAIRPNGGQYSDWQVRVIPNKFPALQIEEDIRRTQDGELFQQMGGCGAHEVVIETPQHDAFLGNEPTDHVCNILRILQRRFIDLHRDMRFQSVIIFKNHGTRAGTSLQHPHWQIIATPVVPRMLRLKFMEATNYYDRTGQCLYEALLEQELNRQIRILQTNAEFVALSPFAARLPFETWILPRRSQAGFGLLREEQLHPLAEILKEVLLKLYVGLDDPAFNLTIDTASVGDEHEPYFRWHIRILPRLSTAAGFELGSGMSINTVPPEVAAQFLRNGSPTAS